MAKFLLESKAKASTADKNGWTAAVWALAMGHLGVLQKPDLYRYLKEGHEATTVKRQARCGVLRAAGRGVATAEGWTRGHAGTR